MTPKMRNKLSKTTLAVIKQIPTFGAIVGLAEELGEIWREDPTLYHMANEIQATIIENAAILLQQENTIDTESGNLSAILAEDPQIFVRISNDLHIAKSAIAQRKQQGITRAVLAMVLGGIMSLGIKENKIPNEFFLAARRFDDLDLRILLYCFERGSFWRSVGRMDDDRWISEFPDYHPREIAASLSKLCSYGFAISLQSNDQSNDALPYFQRSWDIDFSELDNFCEKIRLIPIIAMHTSSVDPEIIERALQSPHSSRTFAGLLVPAVRRHPFKGYQWCYATPHGTQKIDWTGVAWEFPSVNSAIEAASKQIGHTLSKWFYIDV